MKIVRYKRIASTNATAKILADKGAPEWTVVASETQTNGRGRLGRRWESPKGGLWFSIILRPILPINRIATLQFLAANALRKAVEKISNIRPNLKWPNDLVIGDRKLAGILVETKIERSKLLYAVVGIGVNVNLTSKQLPEGATSLLFVGGRQCDLEQVLGSSLDALTNGYLNLLETETILDDWWTHCAHRFSLVKIETADGLVQGQCVGLNSDGSIEVKEDAGRKVAVSNGTLRFEA